MDCLPYIPKAETKKLNHQNHHITPRQLWTQSKIDKIDDPKKKKTYQAAHDFLIDDCGFSHRQLDHATILLPTNRYTPDTDFSTLGHTVHRGWSSHHQNYNDEMATHFSEMRIETIDAGISQEEKQMAVVEYIIEQKDQLTQGEIKLSDAPLELVDDAKQVDDLGGIKTVVSAFEGINTDHKDIVFRTTLRNEGRTTTPYLSEELCVETALIAHCVDEAPYIDLKDKGISALNGNLVKDDKFTGSRYDSENPPADFGIDVDTNIPNTRLAEVFVKLDYELKRTVHGSNHSANLQDGISSLTTVDTNCPSITGKRYEWSKKYADSQESSEHLKKHGFKPQRYCFDFNQTAYFQEGNEIAVQQQFDIAHTGENTSGKKKIISSSDFFEPNKDLIDLADSFEQEKDTAEMLSVCDVAIALIGLQKRFIDDGKILLPVETIDTEKLNTVITPTSLPVIGFHLPDDQVSDHPIGNLAFMGGVEIRSVEQQTPHAFEDCNFEMRFQVFNLKMKLRNYLKEIWKTKQASTSPSKFLVPEKRANSLFSNSYTAMILSDSPLKKLFEPRQDLKSYLLRPEQIGEFFEQFELDQSTLDAYYTYKAISLGLCDDLITQTCAETDDIMPFCLTKMKDLDLAPFLERAKPLLKDPIYPLESAMIISAAFDRIESLSYQFDDY